MVRQAIERNPLQTLRILEEGSIAVRSYTLAECCRQHNISQSQYHQIRQAYAPFGKPIPFPNKETAMQYLRGQYNECLQSLCPFLKEGEPEGEPMTTKAKRKQGRMEGEAMHGLDQNLVECIAIDMLENPDKPKVQIAKRWEVSEPTIYRIRSANHPKLSDKTREMLMVRFCDRRATPQVIEWLSELDRDPPQPESNESPTLATKDAVVPNIIPKTETPSPQMALVPYKKENQTMNAQDDQLKSLRSELAIAIRERDEARAQLSRSKSTPDTDWPVRALVPVVRKAMRQEGITDIAFQSVDGTKIRFKREEEIMV